MFPLSFKFSVTGAAPSIVCSLSFGRTEQLSMCLFTQSLIPSLLQLFLISCYFGGSTQPRGVDEWMNVLGNPRGIHSTPLPLPHYGGFWGWITHASWFLLKILAQDCLPGYSWNNYCDQMYWLCLILPEAMIKYANQYRLLTGNIQVFLITYICSFLYLWITFMYIHTFNVTYIHVTYIPPC